MSYGVCSNGKDCGLSYQDDFLSPLLDDIQVIQQREFRGVNVDALMPHLDLYWRYFQRGLTCTACGWRLIKLTQPTTGLAPESAEYENVVRANALLAAKEELIRLGKLAAED
jgi:hypothetical protein